MNTYRILNGDAMQQLQTLADGSVHCCVTSPPYWGLRDDGTLWLNLGDSYAGNASGGFRPGAGRADGVVDDRNQRNRNGNGCPPGLKPKDLVGIPWRVAFALQDAGWWLRAEIIWAKRAPMPESVSDRPTRSHEHIFLLTKAARYFYDAEAVREPSTGQNGAAASFQRATKDHLIPNQSAVQHRIDREPTVDTGYRNQRDVWLLGPEPYPEAHFATFPTEIPRRAILAGTSERGCCPACGAPWRRVVEKSSASAPASWKGSKFDDGKNLVVHPNVQRRENATTDSRYPDGTTAKRLALLRQQARENGGEYTNHNVTTGWQPTCTCDAGDPIPCTVLDPFMGSGTTLAVAVSLGRDSIGCELNPEYIALARQRITTIGPLLAIEEHYDPTEAAAGDRSRAETHRLCHQLRAAASEELEKDAAGAAGGDLAGCG